MAKNNYNKVDNVTDEGLLKLKAKNLLDDSTIASRIRQVPADIRSTRERLVQFEQQQRQERRLIGAAMQFDVNRLFKKNKQVYTAIGTYHEEFTQLIRDIPKMDENQWKRLLEIKDKLDLFKKSLVSNQKTVADESIIQTEKKKHVNKRFNVNEKWLPLY